MSATRQGSSARAFPLQRQKSPGPEVSVPGSDIQIPTLNVPGTWESVFEPSARSGLEAILPRFLEPRRAWKEKPLPAGAVCSFCELPRSDTRRCVAGPGVYICDDCTMRATAIDV